MGRHSCTLGVFLFGFYPRGIGVVEDVKLDCLGVWISGNFITLADHQGGTESTANRLVADSRRISTKWDN